MQPIRSPYATTLATALKAALPTAAWRTRFAPAPTGHLHLGHVVNALYVWGIARCWGGQVVLRIEDHDRTRVRPEYERDLLDDLDWLGCAPDVQSTDEFRKGATVYRQSDNVKRYTDILTEWDMSDKTYACNCTRTEIARIVDTEATRLEHDAGIASSARDVRYPGTCARRRIDSASTPGRRARGFLSTETFTDIRLGIQSQVPAVQCGDVLLRDRNTNFTYQFAVTVDDFDQAIDVVIRGEDLLPSTGRQIQLSRGLGRETPPLFLHHPLLFRGDGMKLSKSLGDTGVRELRAAGMRAADVLGRAAWLAGLIANEMPLSESDIAMIFACKNP